MRERRPLHKQAMPKVEQNGLGVTEKEDMETAQIEAREKEKKAGKHKCHAPNGKG